MNLHLDNILFLDTIIATSKKLNVPQAFVEKDY
jgi:hypothetical protein